MPAPLNSQFSSSSLKTTIIPSSSPCEDCLDPIYSSPELTSQCTDQCVVIPCNGLDYSQTLCQGDIRCDLVCNGATNCTDCTGFEEFLQCCTDYHSTIQENESLESLSDSSMSWDSSLDEFLCACASQTPDPSVSPQLATASSPSTQIEAHHYMPPPRDMSSAPEISLHESCLNIMLDQQADLACMWGACQARFSSLSDLVAHVNLEHLQLSLGSHVPTQPAKQRRDHDFPSPSCRWRHCEAHPSAESVPSSLSNDLVDAMLSSLANHLLHDHLGSYRLSEIPFITQQKPEDPVPSQLNSSVSEDRVTSPSPYHHERPTNHKCHWQSCEASFNTFDDLTTHITNVHVGGGKAHYECFWEGCNRNCNNGFSSKQKICRHLQSHTGHRPHQCDICHQYFSEAATLQQHMRRHTQEKPYMCDFPGCGKSFAITGALTIHKRIHNGHKPFKCKYCDKAFAESSNLSKHLRTHTGARPYSCLEPGCDKSFARPDQLTRHSGVHRRKANLVGM